MSPVANKVCNLWFDGSSGRFMLNDHELHCGDCFDVEVCGEWVDTRIEHSSRITHSNGWYLITHPDMPLGGRKVKREEA